jgi:hypothetical protein
VGVLKVYRISEPHHKKVKNSPLPVILKVRLKKGAEPVFMNYRVMREQFTDMLLTFFEKKVIYQDAPDDEEPFHPEPSPHEF